MWCLSPMPPPCFAQYRRDTGGHGRRCERVNRHGHAGLWAARGVWAYTAGVGAGHAGRGGGRSRTNPAGVNGEGASGWPHPLQRLFLTLLAEAYGQAGQPETGLRVLAEAATLMATTDGRLWEAERVPAEASCSCTSRIPMCPRRKPVSTRPSPWPARNRPSMELRAAISLSRLWQQQGQPDAACQLLTPIYSWFTEGFATPDLHEAKVYAKYGSRG